MEEKERINLENNFNKVEKNEISDEKKFKSNLANYWGVTPSQLLIAKNVK